MLIRLFSFLFYEGVYTMASKHDTNVKATRDTWAKKCDGFVAFSTVVSGTIHTPPLVIYYLSTLFDFDLFHMRNDRTLRTFRR